MITDEERARRAQDRWLEFGAHVDVNLPDGLEFDGEDESGLPLWERAVRREVPPEQEVFPVDMATDPVLGVVLPGGAVLTGVHSAEKCAGRPCVIHNPSDHHMRDWPLVWRADKGIMERLCLHKVGHPDTDDLVYHVSQGRSFLGVHGCDGCCLL